MMFSSGDDGDEIAATGQPADRLPGLRPLGHRGRRHGAGGDEDERLRLRAGLGHRQVDAHRRRLDPGPPAYLYGGGGGTSHLFAQPSYQKGVVPASHRELLRRRARTARSRTSRWSATPTPGSSSGRARPSPTARSSTASTASAAPACPRPLFAGVVAVANQVHGGAAGLPQPEALQAGRHRGLPRRRPRPRRSPTRVVRVDYVNGFDATDGTDHVPAHAQPDRDDLHPQGLRRRHRRRQPQRCRASSSPWPPGGDRPLTQPAPPALTRVTANGFRDSRGTRSSSRRGGASARLGTARDAPPVRVCRVARPRFGRSPSALAHWTGCLTRAVDPCRRRHPR